jgi:sugar phosphate isomerase/epimerase
VRELDLRTGYACDQRCRFCDQGDRRERIAQVPLPELVEAMLGGGDGVWLAGGEATRRPDLPRLVEAARNAGFRRVGIQTNGRILATRSAADDLRRAGLSDAVVALHAPAPHLHDWLTQTPGSWRQAVEGIRRLVAAGVRTRVLTVATRTGLSGLPELAGQVVALGAEALRVAWCREEGAAIEAARTLVPRFSLAKEPLSEAIGVLRDARRELDTTGIPLCVHPSPDVAADRADAPQVRRWAPLPEGRARAFGPRCIGCALRPVCPGVDPAYLDRFGDAELGGAPVEGSLLLDAREGSRRLRQRLVRAARLGATRVTFAAEQPWTNAALPELVREAHRLGFQAIEVHGALAPLPPAAIEKLAGLTRVVAPEGQAALEEQFRGVTVAHVAR